MQKLVLNTRLTTLNEFINAERTNKFKANSLKKDNEKKIRFLAKTLHFEKLTAKSYYVIIEWFNYRTDPDNTEFAQKFIFDALQVAGILKNDNGKNILQKIHLHLKNDSKHEFCHVLFFDEKQEFINYFVENV